MRRTCWPSHHLGCCLQKRHAKCKPSRTASRRPSPLQQHGQRSTALATSLCASVLPFDTLQRALLDTAPSLHPSSAHIMAVYQTIFFEKIDPLIKVLHRPTAEALLAKALRAPASLLPGELSVVFSIYLACLCSMPDADASACCGGIPKTTALATYKGAGRACACKGQRWGHGRSYDDARLLCCTWGSTASSPRVLLTTPPASGQTGRGLSPGWAGGPPRRSPCHQVQTSTST